MGNRYLDIKSKEKIAIIDCNNFYVSCERLFQPGLDSEATVVLSNNDGCIIARSPEIKVMGIKMGQPLFKLDQKAQGIMKKFSSNYELYGDISDRIAHILKRLVPRVEIYSIDESFLDLSHIPEDKLLDEIKSIQSTIQRLTGIPVSIGVAPNKTLAKLCNHLSKTQPERKGVCSYWNLNRQVIDFMPIDEVWGIGRQYKKRLNELSVQSVKDFLKLDSMQVKQVMGVGGLRTWCELSEALCHPLDTEFKIPKMITCSRSFGSSVWEHSQMRNAFWTFLQNCHRKLVRENLDVTRVTLFATTNRFEDDYTYWSQSFELEIQTHDFNDLWNQISSVLEELPTTLWYKAGINFSGLKPQNVKQERLIRFNFEQAEPAEVEKQKWQTRRDFLSQRYTTNWDEIPLVF